MELESDLTCPLCGHTERLTMPTDACLFFHECSSCRARLRPLTDHCCVFCSFGSVPCPPIQAGRTACCAPFAEESGVEIDPIRSSSPSASRE